MIDNDLAFIAQQAIEHQDDYAAFRYFVELQEIPDTEFDALIEHLADPIINQIDCKQCANCCRSLDVYLTPSDAQHLAAGLLIPLDEISNQYVDHPRAQKEDEWGVFKSKPCVFLKDKLCSVYDHRPEACRTYPEFTPDFRWQIEHILAGVGSCPIIYNVIEAVKLELQW